MPSASYRQLCLMRPPFAQKNRGCVFCLSVAFAQVLAPVLDDWEQVYHWTVEAEPVAERFGGQQELEPNAQAAVRPAGVQALEACSTGQSTTLQTGTA